MRGNGTWKVEISVKPEIKVNIFSLRRRWGAYRLKKTRPLGQDEGFLVKEAKEWAWRSIHTDIILYIVYRSEQEVEWIKASFHTSGGKKGRLEMIIVERQSVKTDRFGSETPLMWDISLSDIFPVFLLWNETWCKIKAVDQDTPPVPLRGSDKYWAWSWAQKYWINTGSFLFRKKLTLVSSLASERGYAAFKTAELATWCTVFCALCFYSCIYYCIYCL